VSACADCACASVVADGLCSACIGDGPAKCPCDACSSKAERAWDSFCSDFYGGSGPVTADEQHLAAHDAKRGAR
jgi:hypothetical protein